MANYEVIPAVGFTVVLTLDANEAEELYEFLYHKMPSPCSGDPRAKAYLALKAALWEAGSNAEGLRG